MIGKDKIWHFGISVLIAMLSALVLNLAGKDIFFSLVIVVLVGAGKEVYDSLSKGIFDIEDLFADVAGGLLGLFIIAVILYNEI